MAGAVFSCSGMVEMAASNTLQADGLHDLALLAAIEAHFTITGRCNGGKSRKRANAHGTLYLILGSGHPIHRRRVLGVGMLATARGVR